MTRPLWTDQSVPEPGRVPLGWDEPVIIKDRRLGVVIMDSLDDACLGRRVGRLPLGVVHQCDETCTMHNRPIYCCRIAGHYGLHWASTEDLGFIARIEGQDA